MTVTDVDIANSALDHIGERPINALTDDRKAARLISRNLPLVRDKLIRTYPWRFATTRAALVVTSTTNAFGFTNLFAKPDDCLRIIGVWDANYPKNYYSPDDYPWVLEKQFIHSDVSTLNLMYSAQITDPANFDSIFVELLAVDVAAKIAFNLTSGTDHSRTLKAQRDELLADARIADSFEGIPADRETDDWMGRRFGSSYGRGPRNYTTV